MREVKDILDESQEKMDMAVMYLEDALAHIRAGKADVRLLDSSHQQCSGSQYSRRPQHRHQAVGQKHVPGD